MFHWSELIGLTEKARPQQLTLTSPLHSTHLPHNTATSLSLPLSCLSIASSCPLVYITVFVSVYCFSFQFPCFPLNPAPYLSFDHHPWPFFLTFSWECPPDNQVCFISQALHSPTLHCPLSIVLVFPPFTYFLSPKNPLSLCNNSNLTGSLPHCH